MKDYRLMMLQDLARQAAAREERARRRAAFEELSRLARGER